MTIYLRTDVAKPHELEAKDMEAARTEAAKLMLDKGATAGAIVNIPTDMREDVVVEALDVKAARKRQAEDMKALIEVKSQELRDLITRLEATIAENS